MEVSPTEAFGQFPLKDFRPDTPLTRAVIIIIILFILIKYTQLPAAPEVLYVYDFTAIKRDGRLTEDRLKRGVLYFYSS